ncbi:MAG: DUF305 domain-containing protein [Propionibacteriaceae bacterium]|nr:DUF305 domain-containing protein [Propionibacteriaceae bacterium]
MRDNNVVRRLNSHSPSTEGHTVNKAKTALKATIATLALAANVGLAGCANDNAGDMPGMDHGSGSSQAPSSTGASSSLAGEFNNADVMFAQGMIPHHQQAVSMSDITLKKPGVNADVTALAKEIKAAQQPEIDAMTGWLKAWGQKVDGGMGGMDHGNGDDGMATDAELEQLDKANAADAARMYLEMMTKHHEGAIKMAQTEMKDGKNPEAVQLAKDIVTSQQKEIIAMEELLARL